MTLEDVARLISPEKPQQIMKIFGYLRNTGKTADQIAKDCDINIWTFRKYLTKMKYWGLISKERNEKRKTIYYIDGHRFNRRTIELLTDPIDRLTKF